LRHPLIAEGKRKLGTVIHREEFTKLLLDFASGTGAQKLEVDAHDALKKALEEGGITDPDQALKNIRAISLQLEASNPELSNHLRDGLAILHEAPSDFVARVNSWFDQTIDRVSQRFTTYTHWITIGVSILVVLAVQLEHDRDSRSPMDRRSIPKHHSERGDKAVLGKDPVPTKRSKRKP